MAQQNQPQKRGFLQKAKEYLVGAPAESREVSKGYSPQQQGIMDFMAQLGQMGLLNNNQYIQGLQGQMQQNRSNFGIEPIMQQAKYNLENETLPTIANRFLAGNTRNSSGFQNAIGSAGYDFEAAMAALRNQYGQQQHQNLLQEQGQAFNREGNYLNQLQMGLQPQNDILYVPESQGMLQQLPGALARAGGAYLSGGLSEAAGAGLNALAGGGQQQGQQQNAMPQQGGRMTSNYMNSVGQSSSAPGLFQQPLGQTQQNALNPQQLQPQNYGPTYQQQNPFTQITSMTPVQQAIRLLGTPDARKVNPYLGRQ